MRGEAELCVPLLQLGGVCRHLRHTGVQVPSLLLEVKRRSLTV